MLEVSSVRHWVDFVIAFIVIGSGASVGIIKDVNNGKEYFCKISGLNSLDMLRAEFFGVKEMYDTNTIRVPRPICYGEESYTTFAVFEKLSIGGYGSYEQMATKLASMHRSLSPNDMYGWKMNNTIGATFQPNNYTPKWADFWDKYRLGHMLSLCKKEGAAFTNEKELREKVYEILSNHECVPSLVHGDLWSGNKAFTSDGEPVIYDPAVYYGDREVDIAMTSLFGSFGSQFYNSYHAAWPLEEGFEKRKIIYNLYHILNHYVLFGGGYLNEANSMIATILKMKS